MPKHELMTPKAIANRIKVEMEMEMEMVMAMVNDTIIGTVILGQGAFEAEMVLSNV